MTGNGAAKTGICAHRISKDLYPITDLDGGDIGPPACLGQGGHVGEQARSGHAGHRTTVENIAERGARAAVDHDWHRVVRGKDGEPAPADNRHEPGAAYTPPQEGFVEERRTRNDQVAASHQSTKIGVNLRT